MYQQLLLVDASQKLVTINTQRGLYEYTDLPFGVASALALFQRVMDTMLQGIPGTLCYIDNILITAKDNEKHLRILAEVLQRLQKYRFHLKKDKYQFLQRSVETLAI